MSIFIIAEAGINHGGSLTEALHLVHAAKDAFANAVKFQMFSSRRLWGDDRIKHLELSDTDMRQIANHCADVGIEFMCTPFGIPEVEFLAPLVKRMKIASGCIGRTELLRAVAETNLPVILSTGMSEPSEIAHALGFLNSDVTLLHCTSAYPCPLEQVNLKAMVSLREIFGLKVGFSDHTAGITTAIGAAALGAKVIEKHFTRDRTIPGPDQSSSIEPWEFRAMVRAIMDTEKALGDGVKLVQSSELELRKAWRNGNNDEIRKPA